MHPILESLFQRYPDLSSCREDIQQAISVLEISFQHGGKLLICGNGGSAADCEHIVGELMKSFSLPRTVPRKIRRTLIEAFSAEGAYLADYLQQALPAISLTSHSALSTAIANDVAAEMVFAQQVYGYGKPGDVLLAISTSGRSRNVICALQVAKVLEIRTIGLTGASAGAFPDLCDVTICVPSNGVIAIQERHLPIYHAICLVLEETFFGNHYGEKLMASSSHSPA